MARAESWRRVEAAPDPSLPDRRSGRTYTYSDGETSVTVELGVVGDRWEVIGLDVRSYPSVRTRPKGKLTVTGLRALPLGTLVTKAGSELRKSLSKELEEAGPSESVDEQEHHRVSIRAVAAERGLAMFPQPSPARGRPRYSDERVKEAVQIYNDASLVPAARRKPTKAVAEQLYVSYSTARRIIRRAREKGFLPPAG
jgi:hypothetical protein